VLFEADALCLDELWCELLTAIAGLGIAAVSKMLAVAVSIQHLLSKLHERARTSQRSLASVLVPQGAVIDSVVGDESGIRFGRAISSLADDVVGARFAADGSPSNLDSTVCDVLLMLLTSHGSPLALRKGLWMKLVEQDNHAPLIFGNTQARLLDVPLDASGGDVVDDAVLFGLQMKALKTESVSRERAFALYSLVLVDLARVSFPNHSEQAGQSQQSAITHVVDLVRAKLFDVIRDALYVRTSTEETVLAEGLLGGDKETARARFSSVLAALEGANEPEAAQELRSNLQPRL